MADIFLLVHKSAMVSYNLRSTVKNLMIIACRDYGMYVYDAYIGHNSKLRYNRERSTPRMDVVLLSTEGGGTALCDVILVGVAFITILLRIP